MSKKKKVIILSCMIALLAVTAVFNFILTTGTVSLNDSSVSSSANYFSQYRNERITTRNEELLQLDAIIESAESSSAEYSEALSMKIDLTAITERTVPIVDKSVVTIGAYWLKKYKKEFDFASIIVSGVM